MINPLDLERLAVRIERLQHTRTHGWHPADELQLRQGLPGGFARNKLPDPKDLREWAGLIRAGQESEGVLSAQRDYRNWLQWALTLEGLIRDNDPRNPKRMMRDMARGRPPFGMR